MRNLCERQEGSSNVANPSILMATDPLSGYRVLGFDLETTGFNPKSQRIVQYALVGCEANGNAIQIDELVNPRMRIPPETTNVHGIRDEDVRNAPEFKQCVDEISTMMEGAVIVGHNIDRFDWPFLQAEFLRAGQPMPRPLVILDTLKIARRLKIPPSHKLGILCERFGISLENAHTAGADAAATLLLLHKMMEANPQHFRRPVEDIPDWVDGIKSADKSADRLGPNIEDLEPVSGSHGWLRMTTSGLVIGRGRNRGRTVAELEKLDSNYLNWLQSPAGPLDENAVTALQNERL